MDKQLNCLQNIINNNLTTNCDIHIFDELQSTNSTLKSMVEQGAKEGTVVIARKQTKGRGTQGRKFYSPLNGLYMSILVRPKFKLQQAIYITVATAVAVVDAIKKVTGIKCGIKWVNDIIYKNTKVGGILTEGGFNNSSNTLDYAIIGVGLNLLIPKDGFPQELKGIAGALFEQEVSSDIYPKLIAEIINRTIKLYKQLNKKRYIKAYQKYSILIKREIVYTLNGNKHFGLIKGIDKNARLIVKEDGKKIKLSSGEVKINAWQ